MISDYKFEFEQLHKNILDGLHYDQIGNYIIKHWPNDKKKIFLNDLVESMIKEKK